MCFPAFAHVLEFLATDLRTLLSHRLLRRAYADIIDNHLMPAWLRIVGTNEVRKAFRNFSKYGIRIVINVVKSGNSCRIGMNDVIYHFTSNVSESIDVMLLASMPGIIDATDDTGNTALMYSAWLGTSGSIAHQRRMRFLLVNGANKNATNAHGNTALIYACNGFYGQGVSDSTPAKILINAGADINHCNNDGFTPVMFAAGLQCYIPHGWRSTDEYFVRRTGLSYHDYSGFSIGRKQFEVLGILIDRGATHDILQNRKLFNLCFRYDRERPWFAAMSDIDVERIRILMRTADLDAVDTDGNTPLFALLERVMQCAIHSTGGEPLFLNTINYLIGELLAAGAHIDANGKNAFQYVYYPSTIRILLNAAKHSQRNIVPLLRDAHGVGVPVLRLIEYTNLCVRLEEFNSTIERKLLRESICLLADADPDMPPFIKDAVGIKKTELAKLI